MKNAAVQHHSARHLGSTCGSLLIGSQPTLFNCSKGSLDFKVAVLEDPSVIRAFKLDSNLAGVRAWLYDHVIPRHPFVDGIANGDTVVRALRNNLGICSHSGRPTMRISTKQIVSRATQLALASDGCGLGVDKGHLDNVAGDVARAQFGRRLRRACRYEAIEVEDWSIFGDPNVQPLGA
jgi:hypothetical protein